MSVVIRIISRSFWRKSIMERTVVTVLNHMILALTDTTTEIVAIMWKNVTNV